jgi:hypothetical protein
MMSIISQIIASLARCGAAIAEHLNLPEVRRKGAAKAESAERAEKAAAAATVSQAVYAGDEKRVNEELSKLLPAVLLAAALSALCGCGKTVALVYVPADRHAIPMVCTNGVAGWFVPNATFDELLKSARRARELEQQQAVTARMEGRK